MPSKSQEPGQSVDLPGAVTALAAGGAIALGGNLLVLALTAWLVSRGSLGAQWADGAGAPGAFLGCLIGGRYAISAIRSRALAVGLAVGGIFCLLWTAAGLFWLDGGGIAPGLAAAALLGGAAGGILSAARKKRRK